MRRTALAHKYWDDYWDTASTGGAVWQQVDKMSGVFWHPYPAYHSKVVTR